jgi:hypothetical protein
MDVQLPTAGGSAFMVSHLPEFWERFGISFTIDGPQFEYYVYDKKSGRDISCSLTVNFDAVARQIHVMTFYPGIAERPEARYLSAVCFFMIMQHFGNFLHIGPGCGIVINTRQGVFDTFYSQLKDFDFHILLGGEADRIDIESCLLLLAMDTSMVGQRPLVETRGWA